MKERGVTLEKHKKLMASMKPEEPVPLLDVIEQKLQKDDNGVEIAHWFI